MTTDFNNAGLTDTQIAVYETSSTCDDLISLVEVACSTDGGTINNDQAVLNLDNLNPGQTYYVQIDQGSNSSSGVFGIEINETLSITDSEEIEFDYYPNPVTNQLTIEASVRLDQMTIYDVNGREIKSFSVGDNRKVINMSGLQAGIYFVNIITRKSNKIISVIKK